MAFSMPTNKPGGAWNAAPIAEINITPMVDVMLVLLVIFMVTAPLLMAGVKVDLAKTSAPKISHLNKPLIVSVDAAGELYVGDDLVPKRDFQQRLSELKAKDGDKAVFLRADRSIHYGDVLELMAQIGNAGFHRLSLLSQEVNTATAANEGQPPTP